MTSHRLRCLALCLLAALLCSCGGGDETVTNNYVTPIPLTIETPTLPDAEEGAAYSVALAASGGSGTVTWTLEAGGVNDAWLSLDAAGTLSGTPATTDVGAVTVYVRVEDPGNPSNFDLAVFTFTVAADSTLVRITTTMLPAAYVSQFYVQSLAAEGGSGSYTWAKMAGGTNDTWVSLNTDGSISSVPMSPHIGPVTLKVRVTDQDDTSLTDTASFTFQVYEGAITIDTPDPLSNAATSTAYAVTLEASGGSGSYLWAKETGGSNDGWLSVNSGTGELSGTAPAGEGSVSVVVSVTDANNPLIFAQQTFQLEVKSIALTPGALDHAFVGTAYSQALVTLGGSGAETYSIEPGGSNYGWLTINGSSLESTTAPSATDKGPVTVIVRTTDGALTDTRAYQFQVYDTVKISASLPDAVVGVGYSVLPATSGGTGDLQWSLEAGGTNDGWLSIDPATGRISGTPTSSNLGSVTVVVKVVEQDYPSQSDQESIVFSVEGISILTEEIPDATAGQAWTKTLSATGGSGYYAWSISAGPAWLSIDPDTGRLSGTSTAAAAETLTVTVEDSLDPALTDTRTYTFWSVNTILYEDFGSGTHAMWTSSTWFTIARRDPSTTDRAYVGPHSAHTNTQCGGTNFLGHYSTNINWTGHVTTLPIDLSGATAPVMVYYQWMQTEPNDGGNIKVSIAGQGGPFALETNVFPPYNATVGTESAWSGFHVGPDGWKRVVVDLSAYAGQSNVAIQWNFYSDGSVTAPGWYFDTVHVFDRPASPAPKEPTGPFPADGVIYAPPESADYSSGVTLRWNHALGASTYDFYLGTDYSTVLSATTPTQAGLGVNQATVTSMTSGNQYFWRVDAVGSSTTKGGVWRFSATDPVPILVNELQVYPFSMGPYVELYNPNPAITQDLAGWVIYTSNSGTAPKSFTIPQGIVLGPGQARAFASNNVAFHSYTPYRAWDLVAMDTYVGWMYGFGEGEAWITDPSGNGVDYVGWNLVACHRPADLNWKGSLTQTIQTMSIIRRTSNTDTDSASDFRWDGYVDYGPATGYMGLKDAGQ